MANPTCKTCRWWHQRTSGDLGECRKHAPAIKITVQSTGPHTRIMTDAIPTQPFTSATYFCGDHELIPAPQPQINIGPT